MESNKRVEEVARCIKKIMCPGCTNDLYNPIVQYVATLPEFHPRSEWIECKDRMPDVNRQVFWRFKNGTHGNYKFSDLFAPCQRDAIAWLDFEIPPYVPPESELVRRFRDQYDCLSRTTVMTKENIVTMLKSVAKELADGK